MKRFFTAKDIIGYRVVIAATILVGMFLRSESLTHGVEQHHVWRQAHVASNIEFFLKDGIAVYTKVYSENEQYKLYDFPLYQQMVAVCCLASHGEPVLVGRILNLLIYLASCWIIYKILLSIAVELEIVALCLIAMTFSPLDVYYSRALLPDNLAIWLGLFSFYAFLRWEPDPPGHKIAYRCMFVSGVLSTLIKSPVYLPFVLAMASYLLIRHSKKGCFSLHRSFLPFLAGILFTAVAFKVYSNLVNVGSMSLPASELNWYFGSLRERLYWRRYTEFILRLWAVQMNPLFFVCGLVAIAGIVRRRWDSRLAVLVCLATGSLVSFMLFFSLNLIHDYYQLPYVFIVSSLAAIGFERLCTRIRILSNRVTRVLIFGIAALGGFMWGHIDTTQPEGLLSAGGFIRHNTPSDAFVFYCSHDATWDPSRLYFAHRMGFNLGIDTLLPSFTTGSANTFDQLREKYWSEHKSLFVYASRSTLERNNLLFSNPEFAESAQSSEHVLFRIVTSDREGLRRGLDHPAGELPATRIVP